jgi:hypothetical protein
MRAVVRMLVGAVLSAIALIASSWLLEGHPAGEWVDASLYIALGCFLASQTVLSLPQVFAPRHHGS